MEAATRERKMQKAFVFALTVSAALGLVVLQTARADDRVLETNYYAAYYDRHYGPISDGYWDRHNKYFWYEDTSGRWHQDDGSHFQREPAPGYALIHGTGAPRTH